MAFFLRLEQQNTQFVADVFENHREAEINREREYQAAIYIQAWFRGLRTRCYIKYLNICAVVVQKIWRGFVGRRNYRKKLNVAVQGMMLNYYSDMAMKIQKRWRGFYVRKYVHNFYARKHYLDMVLKKNGQIRERLEEYSMQAKQEMIKHKQDVRQLKVEEEAKKNHFLLSTKQRPGVYNSPYRIYPHEMEFYMRTTKFPPQAAPQSAHNKSKDTELPPIKKLQGPFRQPADVTRQKEKPFQPTLRVQTSFLCLEEAREKDRLDEWRSRLIDDTFEPFTQFRYPYKKLLHSQGRFGHLDDDYLRTVHSDKHVAAKDFKGVNSPVPIFEKLGDTYSKGAGAVC